ncbi:YbaB/EbfC family nucleoid-associated protein [Saccharomonospora iraqiensis]|uniref:YbaB/EbfC family nucleoid-associated protein n=1 Tax=Saccharomonospora iraqiensis TaxID=52698 RepID=UPI00022E31E7|nr:YbaB/EbfC family nucleoid-associated protein [Saccharomonospora iraqiensis]
MSAEFEQLVAQFEQFQSKIRNVDDQLADVGRMQTELADLEATASSADRAITVVAGPGGSVKDIQLTDKALTRSPQELSSSIMSTLQEAVAEAARKQATIVDEHMGGELNTTDQVVETQAQLFGTSPEDLRARMEEARPARPTPPEEEIHEDYSQQDLFGADEDDRPAPPTPPPADDGGSAGDDFLRNLFDDER